MIDILEQTPSTIWKERRNWIDNELERHNSTNGECETGIQAPNLFYDMSLAFCAGAWISVIIMSISVIDSHLRETEALNDKIKTKDLLNKHYKGGDINSLRKLRNQFVHVDSGLSVFNEYDFFNDQEKLEELAKWAIKETIKSLFQTPLLP